MKKVVLLIGALFSVVSYAQAADQKPVRYSTGNFSAPCNAPHKTCQYSLDIEANVFNQRIIGKALVMHGVAACKWGDVPINGTVGQDGVINWRSDKNAVQGCGLLVFRGKFEGDNMVGTFPRFQGVEVPVTFKPVN